MVLSCLYCCLMFLRAFSFGPTVYNPDLLPALKNITHAQQLLRLCSLSSLTSTGIFQTELFSTTVSPHLKRLICSTFPCTSNLKTMQVQQCLNILFDIYHICLYQWIVVAKSSNVYKKTKVMKMKNFFSVYALVRKIRYYNV